MKAFIVGGTIGLLIYLAGHIIGANTARSYTTGQWNAHSETQNLYISQQRTTIIGLSSVVRELQTVAHRSTDHDIPFSTARNLLYGAREYGFPPDLVFNLAKTESNFRRDAVSPVGAIGLLQVMPATAAEMDPSVTRADLFDEEINIRMGLQYLEKMILWFDGDTAKALSAYNGGPGAVKAGFRNRKYEERVMTTAQ